MALLLTDGNQFPLMELARCMTLKCFKRGEHLGVAGERVTHGLIVLRGEVLAKTPTCIAAGTDSFFRLVMFYFQNYANFHNYKF